MYIFDNKVCLVEKKADYHSIKKKDSASTDSDKNVDLDKSDDPIRMYLREMGGVDLLSREGEIAIAKRIEAGKNVMISALLQSPLTARKVFEWKKQIEKNEFSVREIIDIDSTYMDIESESGSEISIKIKLNEKKQADSKLEKSNNDLKEIQDGKNEKYSEDDEFNPSLAAMEEEIKPRVISTINILYKNYSKLIKYQNEKLNCALNAKRILASKRNRL